MEQQVFEAKMKHLEFIQGVITRMNSNSFSMKGWMITIVSALLTVFAASQEMNELFLFVAIIPTLLFWLMDSYYLKTEKQYRLLFDDVKTEKKDDFDMNANLYEIAFIRVLFSKTEWPLYLTIIVLLTIGCVLGYLGVY